jgi:molecular chaperone GrpE (heat shock protein)
MSDDDIRGSVDKFLAGANLGRTDAFEREERAEFLRVFLDTYDSLVALAKHFEEEAARTGAPENTKHAKTVSLVVARMERAFATLDVEPMPGVGEHVDLDCQEVVDTRPSEHEDDVILDEIVRGYTWEGRPLRLGKVVVSRTPDAAAGDEGPEEEQT